MVFAFRRRVCLHKLMVTLCERGQTQQLIEYPFINLQDEVSEDINLKRKLTVLFVEGASHSVVHLQLPQKRM